jgi:lysophospholipase L1-like esterase
MKKKVNSRWYLEGFSLLIFIFIVLGFTFVTSAITITFMDASMNGTLTNVTAEGNFTHLTLNASNLFFYMPFDVNFTLPNNISYDYSPNNFDGRAVPSPSTAFGNWSWSPNGFFSGGAYTSAAFTGSSMNHINVTTLWGNNTYFNDSYTISVRAVFIGAPGPQLELLGFGNAFDNYNSTWCLRLSNSAQLTFQYRNETSGGLNGIVSSGVLAASGVPFMFTAVVNRTGGSNGANRVTLYVNGTSYGTTLTANGTYSNITRTMAIGWCYGSGQNWNGSIDDVMLFNKALSATEVSALYQNTTARFAPGGTQVFSNLNLSERTEQFVNVTLNMTLPAPGLNFTVRIGNISGGDYQYSGDYPVINGQATSLPLGTVNNQSIMVIFNATSTPFFSPVLQGLSIISYPTIPYVATLNTSILSPAHGANIFTNNITVNVSITNTTDLADPFKTYSFVDINRSLLVWWTMDEGNSTTTFDKSGRGINLVHTSGVSRNTTFAPAYGNASLEFNMSTSQATAASGLVSSRWVQTREVTMSLWFNPNSPVTAVYDFVNCAFVNKGFAWYLVNGSTNSLPQNNTMRLTLYNGTTGQIFVYSDHFKVDPGSWYHLAFKYYRDTVYFYVNGAPLMGSTSYPGYNLTDCGLNQLYMGESSNYGPKGKIDDVLIFDRALSDEEISALYSVTGNGNRSFSARLHGITNGSLDLRSLALSATRDAVNSTNLTLTAHTSGPYFLNANYSFENATNITSISAYVDRGIYPFASAYNFSQLNGSAYYRLNGGSWVLFNSTTYVPFNYSTFGGLFGDSITGGGQTYRWASYFDPTAHTYFISATNLTNGIGGTWCYQVRMNILENATNGTSIFLQCGTNDLGNHAPLETITRNYSVIFNESRQKNLSIYLINVLPRQENWTIENTSRLNTWLYSYYLTNNSDRLIKGFADVYNSSLKNETGTANLTSVADGVHPNDLGAAVYANIVFKQAYRYKYHDGFYAEFTPGSGILNDTYDLKWNITTPTGESSEYQWNSAFSLAGTYNATPVVLLSSPNNGSSVSSAAVSFATEVSTNFTLINATFYLWNASGDLINSTTNTTLTGTDANLSLSVTLPYEGVFSWNYGVVNNYNYPSMNGTNWTLTYTVPAGSSSSSSGGSSSSSSGSGGGSFLPTPRVNTTVPPAQSNSSSSSSGGGSTAPAPIEPETTWLGSAFETLTNTLRSALSKTAEEISSSPVYWYIGGGLILAGAVAGVVMALRARVKKQYGYVPHSWWLWRK